MYMCMYRYNVDPYRAGWIVLHSPVEVSNESLLEVLTVLRECILGDNNEDTYTFTSHHWLLEPRQRTQSHYLQCKYVYVSIHDLHMTYMYMYMHMHIHNVHTCQSKMPCPYHTLCICG